MKKQVVVISNEENGTYFFSKDHCQNHGLGTDFVPCTHYLPSLVTPRKGLPNGIIKNASDLVCVFYSDMQEIHNPDPSMQPDLSELL